MRSCFEFQLYCWIYKANTPSDTYQIILNIVKDIDLLRPLSVYALWHFILLWRQSIVEYLYME